MTGAVAELVLKDNYEQTETLSLAEAQAPGMVDVHARFLDALESRATSTASSRRCRAASELAERSREDGGLTRPELAVALAYSKIDLYAELLDSDVPEDPHLSAELDRYFPHPLPERFGERMRSHRLRREIIATQVVNNMLHGGGTTFAFRLHEETRRARVGDRARLRGGARHLRDAPPVGRDRGARQHGGRRGPDPDCCSRAAG